MQSEASRELTEIVRPNVNDREMAVVAGAVNKALGGILREQAALNVAWTVLVALRAAANLDAELDAVLSTSQKDERG